MKFAGVMWIYHPKEDVVKNLDSYIRSFDRVYVVDNTEGTDNSHLFQGYDVVYIPLMRNTGCGALNTGWRKAAEDKMDYIMLLDQDTRFSENGVEELKQFAAQSEDHFSCVAPNIKAVGDDGRVYYTQMPENEIQLCRWTTGSGQLICIKDLLEVGGFDENLFLDHVDVDLGIRMYLNGFKTVRIGRVWIYQRFGNSQPRKFLWKTVYPKFANSTRVYYVFRNQKYLTMKYGKVVRKFSKIYVRDTVKILLYEDNKTEKLNMARRGLRDARKGCMGIFRG